MTTKEFKKLPKIELHCHLDGSLSREFIEERLGRSVEETEIRVSKDCRNLEEYLGKFVLPIACLQDQAGLTGAVRMSVMRRCALTLLPAAQKA